MQVEFRNARENLDALGDRILAEINDPEEVYTTQHLALIDLLLRYNYGCYTNILRRRYDYLHGLYVRAVAERQERGTSPTPDERLFAFGDAILARHTRVEQIAQTQRRETLHQLIFIGAGDRNHTYSWELAPRWLYPLTVEAATRREERARIRVDEVLFQAVADAGARAGSSTDIYNIRHRRP
eukprot:GHVU01001336.1.p2 GENE.GHVU01001336.1~~GHVU01001336.1.p2  ORF type:complete len:183 (+),score=13.92 GHVU01001336.1:208-756(+)